MMPKDDLCLRALSCNEVKSTTEPAAINSTVCIFGIDVDEYAQGVVESNNDFIESSEISFRCSPTTVELEQNNHIILDASIPAFRCWAVNNYVWTPADAMEF